MWKFQTKIEEKGLVIKSNLVKSCDLNTKLATLGITAESKAE